MERFRASVRRLNRLLHYVAGAGIVAVMLLTVADITLRKVFSRPISGTVEITELAMVVIVYLGLAFTEHQDEHISVDIVYVRLRPRTQAALDVFASLLHVVILALMGWRLVEYSRVQFTGAYETGVLRIPIWPIVLVAVAGTLTLALAVVAQAFARRDPDGSGP